jgi:predicted patatin/cPLA2 family phospholipase
MKKAGLILEGGATRGVFTSGVLDYLMKEDIYFPYIVGVSAGSCNAVDYVSKQIGRTKDCMIHKDKQNGYFNLKTAIKQRSLFDMDMIFDKYPNHIYPFDYETYFNSDIKCEIVTTNCISGRAEYMSETKDKEKLMKICRASSSMPLVTPTVDIEGVPYLDGGIADSIPILHSLRSGYKKNVIILTRNKGYRKKLTSKARHIYNRAYKKYPKLARAICLRPYVYNRTLEYIEKWEEEGKIFVIRPEIKTVSRTETDYQILTDFYQHGYDKMKEQCEKMLQFLGK